MFHLILEAVSEAMDTTPSTTSLVENLNSRLRNYFFLRKQLGSGYLDLLRFFLNHRTFRRSRCPERVGKSPTELMTGQEHPHCLELLGFERFQSASEIGLKHTLTDDLGREAMTVIRICTHFPILPQPCSLS
ncbi:MAG: hypothetical protein N5P05_004693 (plasmid) [Chroococcopsis gigantea SAG 12.99]|jgi:hypothetical protein|nr:hypothetical protein [Chroococcopsis gigantea SAG 12.99]